MKSDSNDYVIRVFSSPLKVSAAHWNALLATQAQATPFMRHEYLAALHESGSATPQTGWTPRFVTLWQGEVLVAACALYLKDHSYGEYVFDWAWANAYEQHGVAYYPKAVVAAPFTPVPGARLLACDAPARQALARVLVEWCAQQKLSSLHLLFAGDEDVTACAQAGLMLRHTVQFHWNNAQYRDFDHFLTSLAQDKRKKIRQERRKVAEAGVSFRWSLGCDISPRDWDFFYRCYERTYYEHGNAPYLSRDFFRRMADTMPEHWLLFVADRGGQPIASSLIAINSCPYKAEDPFDSKFPARPTVPMQERMAYGRYWGALERVDCLHFEACYYQPLQWCIEHGFQRFEGGAQGEHKMARALLPVKT
ncbi:MAG: GNAT family N-acetyltransferase, partial [Gammaproteobacteria bacterium]